MKNLLQQKSFFFDKTVAKTFAKNEEYKENSYEKNLLYHYRYKPLPRAGFPENRYSGASGKGTG
jgi:hypothetical protein